MSQTNPPDQPRRVPPPEFPPLGQPPAHPTRTSALAITALVLGLLGVCFFGLGVVGMILEHFHSNRSG